MILTLLSFIINAFVLHPGLSEPTQRWLVELDSPDANCLNIWWETNGWIEGAYIKKALPVGNWWVVEIPRSKQESLGQLTCVIRMTEDHRIKWRDTQPNDPVYINQADMNLIGMPKAWDVAKGGVTAQGDTIVVAIIDDGYQTSHEDLGDNIWVNRGEIPNDGEDNDDNGYTDDYVGLNVESGTDNHPVLSHGTSVLGIIGAQGNNLIGVSGVNWKVKMMLVSGASFESEIIEGYQYILDMRKKYRQTNGAEGAFVVATNTSGGIDFALAEDHPLWCEMYDKMGQEGILSVCAAPNQPISVDEAGDMPTTCTSPYMIAVTNVDETDVLVSNAGFGPQSIDIGAPGHGTVTIEAGNQYGDFPGTSSAAPHVTGTIALMYSSPCSAFLANVKSDPDGTAAAIRDSILSSAKANNSLNEITVTGGRVQVDAAIRTTLLACEEPSEPELAINSIQPNFAIWANTIQIFFSVGGETTGIFFELFDARGALVYHFIPNEDEISQGYLEMDAGPLPAGVYFLSLRNKKAKDTKRIVVLN